MSEGRLETLQVRLLGDFAVLRSGGMRHETPWERYDTTTQVFKFLLLQPRLRCHPSTIVDALWPEVDADKAAERLQFHVKRLRALLRPDTLAVTGLRLVVLDKTIAALDAAIFTPIDAVEFAGAASRALTAADMMDCRTALALYGGELLPRDLTWNWTNGRRRELAERRNALLDHTARLLHAAGETRSAVPLLVDLLAADPCNERGARLLMECYHAEDERTEAARVYHTLRARLQEELHVLPGARTEEVYAAIRQAPAAPPVAARVEAGAAALPAQRRHRPRPTELMSLFGRDEELSYVELLLSMVRQRGGSYAVFICGEAGVGKTHLAHELLNRARRHGYTVLAGFARAGGSAPYAPIVEALRVHAARLPDEALRAALGHARGATALIPEVAARLRLAPAPAAGDDLMRRDLVHAVAALAADKPMILLLDDLHDADAASLAWLGDLLLAGSTAGLLVMATLRAEPSAPPALEAVIEECRRRGAGETLALHGLPLEAMTSLLTKLLGHEPTTELARAIHDKTRGNSFLIGEIVRELRAREALQPQGSAWGLRQGRLPVPESIRGLARTRLNTLDDEARRLVALAAVAGAQPVSVLARLGEWSAGATLDLLDRLVAAGIFEEREGYRFRHDMLREAIYDLQSPDRRALLHATVAAALEQDYLAGAAYAPEAAELAYHYLLAGPAQAAQAARYSTLAGDRAAALFAPHEAVARYRDALAHTAEDQHAGLHERLGRALAATGEHGAAVASFEAALRSVTEPRTEDGFARVRLLWRLGTALKDMGRHAEAARRLAEADAGLRGADGAVPGEEYDLLQGRIRGARAWLALETDDFDAARDLAGEALHLLEPIRDAALDRQEVRNALAGALFYHGYLDEAKRYLEEQLEDARALGHPALLCRLHANRGLILLLQGNLPAALAAIDQATAVLGDYRDEYNRTHLLANRAAMLADSGTWDDALATLDLVIQAGERESWPQLTTRAHARAAVPLLARGRLGEAREHLEQCITAATRPGFDDETPLGMALVHRAALFRVQGDLVAAELDLARSRDIAERLNRPQELADVHLGLSRLCGARRDAEGAARHARAALEIATAHHFGLYRGRAGVALAGALRDADRDVALATLEDAVATLRSCEARPDLAEALGLLAALLPPGPAARHAYGEAAALRRRLGIVMTG